MVQIYLFHCLCLNLSQFTLRPKIICCFASNQVKEQQRLIESGSSKSQSQSQGHNETLAAQGGLSIKSYYPAAPAPMSEWEAGEP